MLIEYENKKSEYCTNKAYRLWRQERIQWPFNRVNFTDALDLIEFRFSQEVANSECHRALLIATSVLFPSALQHNESIAFKNCKF